MKSFTVSFEYSVYDTEFFFDEVRLYAGDRFPVMHFLKESPFVVVDVSL